MNQLEPGCLAITCRSTGRLIVNNGIIVTVGKCLGSKFRLPGYGDCANPQYGDVWEISKPLLWSHGEYLKITHEYGLRRIDCNLEEETQKEQREVIV